MVRVRGDVYRDGEIGRGRRNDSSSSRESSPARGPKRSFSPTSDDGESVTEAIAAEDDNTPPPAERPLIRQALGFAVNQPPQSINTYEATPASAPIFLPGQEVPMPPKPKITKPKKTGVGVKRPRKPEAYVGQTSRFRIQTYDPTPSAEPPIHSGTGPYASLYRESVPPFETRQYSPAVSTSSQGSYPGSAATPSNFAGSSRAQSSGPSVATRSGQGKSNASKGKTTTAKNKATQPSYKAHPKATAASSQQLATNPEPIPGNAIGASASSSGSYYRRDYVQEHAMSISPPREMQRQRTQFENRNPAGYSSSMDPAASSSARGGIENGGAEAPKRNKHPLRMVTILIQDIRSGVTDHQLAEVKIPLRPGDDPRDGFWADAKDLSQQLQASPSRIDGPARVYTLRGKYRQFLLRVSADNVDECISANVIIQPDRTLDVVVEMLHPPGAPPPAPNIPRELYSPSYEESNGQPDRMDVDPRRDRNRDVYQYEAPESSRKRQTSPSFDDYDHYPSFKSQASKAYSSQSVSKAAKHAHAWEMSPRSNPRTTSDTKTDTLENSPPKKRRSYAKEAMRQRSYSSEYSAPPEETAIHRFQEGYDSTSEEEISPIETFIQAVEKLLQKDQLSWTGFFRAKAGTGKTSEVVKQFECIQRMCDTWVGKIVPGFDFPIERHHIYTALHFDDATLIENLPETMELLALYGKNGRHYEDARIVKLLSEKSDVHPLVFPINRFLKILREIDAHWKAIRADQPPQSQSQPPPQPQPQSQPQPQLQPGNAESSHSVGSRTTKALFV
ncbi:hypothetical protein B0H34DRAFT_699813 [Crassisporium funariophilum]|nr:hypothetical protein B0H34DRAFT_699813 [Crassisporium funariophilum]